jgi:predicted nucleotidyltransferase component of viral defense system
VNISREHLRAEAEATGFREDVLEKVLRLLGLLDGLRAHPFLKGRLALKGGTALNLFYFDVPRLSVDIDVNYIGGTSRDDMLADKPKIEEAVVAVCKRDGFTVRRIPSEHAGGKLQRLAQVLPLAANELAFLERVLERGEIAPELITDDGVLADRIATHPGLLWKTLNVRKHKGLKR